jgi:hypothetical protein
MSFAMFVPGQHLVQHDAFRQAGDNKWICELEQDTPVDEIACFISAPLSPGTALGCHIAAAPFNSWHYLGSITTSAPSAVFKTRYVWSAADAVPTHVQFGVSLEPESQLAQTPAERVSAEVLEVGRRIGQDLYSFVASFATNVWQEGEQKIVLPQNVLERWIARFRDKCQRQGLDWLKSES